jgi:hypothetical protein
VMRCSETAAVARRQLYLQGWAVRSEQGEA